MKNEFVTYEIALELKELGFDEPCFGYHINESKELILTSEKDINYLTGTSNTTFTSAPTFSQCFRWFREKYGLHGTPLPTSFEILDKNNDLVEWGCIIEQYPLNSYEEAELKCLIKLIEIVKENKQ